MESLILGIPTDTLTLDGVLTALSIVGGLTGWIITTRRGIASERKQYTLSLVMMLREVESLRDADTFMALSIRNGRTFHSDSVTDAEDRQLITLLDYYEFLAISLRHGYIEPKVIRHLRASPMVAAFRASRPYIEERRELLGREDLYEEYERFVEEVGRSKAD